MKDKYSIHLTRRQHGDECLEVTDSSTFCMFGNQNMQNPGPRSSLDKRQFYHLNETSILERAEEVIYFVKIIFKPKHNSNK